MVLGTGVAADISNLLVLILWRWPGLLPDRPRKWSGGPVTIGLRCASARLQRVGQAEARAREMRARVEDERQVYNDWVDLPLIVLAGVR